MMNMIIIMILISSMIVSGNIRIKNKNYIGRGNR